MTLLEPLTFDTDAERRLYQYVERHGSVSRETARDAVGLDDDTFLRSLERLQEKRYVGGEDGTLELELDIGAGEKHDSADITYVVRPAREEDFESLVDTIDRVTARDTYVVAEGLAEELRYDDTLVRHNTVWSRVFFVATVDGHVVGWSHLNLPQVEKLRDTAELTVGVRDSYRGHGIGARLLEQALDWADANDYWKVYNSVARSNEDAIAFLESHGWTQEAVRPDHYAIGDGRVDEVMLAYTF